MTEYLMAVFYHEEQKDVLTVYSYAHRDKQGKVIIPDPLRKPPAKLLRCKLIEAPENLLGTGKLSPNMSGTEIPI